MTTDSAGSRICVDYAQTVLTAAPPVVQVVQVNDADAPPNLRLLIELSGRVPPGYSPFGTSTA